MAQEEIERGAVDVLYKMFILYIMRKISVADARQHLAEILGKVAYEGETFVITQKGCPMAHLVPVIPPKSSDKRPATLGKIRGWLDDNDPFFSDLETTREESRKVKLTNPFRRKQNS